MIYFILTCLVFALAVAINSVSVYAQRRYKYYNRWQNGWLIHSAVIVPAWIAFIYLFVSLNGHYGINFYLLPIVGYVLLLMAFGVFMMALHEIGVQSLTNGNLFGRGKISHKGIYKILKDPIYDSYLLWFIGMSFVYGNAAYLILMLESYIGLNLIESRVE
ncbi:hypothetical protein HYW35_01740 [Candidatus Saccharibacteria bacterium]|nr:hypothetical protein [Candidatus Saccharibacteria bacterium]